MVKICQTEASLKRSAQVMLWFFMQSGMELSLFHDQQGGSNASSTTTTTNGTMNHSTTSPPLMCTSEHRGKSKHGGTGSNEEHWSGEDSWIYNL